MKPLAQACRIQARNNQEEQEKAGAARAAAALGRAFRNNLAPPEFAIWQGRLCPKSKIIQKAESSGPLVRGPLDFYRPL